MNERGSDQDSFDLIERNLILPAVVKLGRPRALVVGDVLRGFQRAAVLQVRGDAGSAKRVVSDPRLDAGVGRPALDHPVGVLLPHRLLLAGLAAGRAKQRAVRVSGDTRRRDVFIEVLF